jgi:hypothetical protein
MKINESKKLSLNSSCGRLVRERGNSSATNRTLGVQNANDLLSHRTNYCNGTVNSLVCACFEEGQML